MPSLSDGKRCAHCGAHKPFSEFSRQRQTSSGYNPSCKVCVIAMREAAENDPNRPECKAPGCTKKQYAKGYCLNHRRLVRKYGCPSPVKTTFEERFWSKVGLAAANECWPWQARLDEHGYGRFRVSSPRRMEPAHRVAYTLTIGEIPEGLFLLHRCDNPPCINPHHMRPGTQYENMQDMVAKGRSIRKFGPKHYEKIVALKAEGLNYVQIGKRLNMIPSTVRNVFLRYSK